MTSRLAPSRSTAIPAIALYGETGGFPDVMHCERISDRAERHDWIIEAHRHYDLHQMFLVERGVVSVSLDGTFHKFESPVGLSIKPRQVHAFRFSSGTEGYVLSMPLAEFGEDLSGPGPVAERLGAIFNFDLGPDIRSQIEALWQAFRTESPLRRQKLKAMTTRILCEIAEKAPAAGASGGRPDAQRHLSGFERLLRVHLTDHWRVADYAAALSVTPTHLSRICREATGLPASAMIEAALVREACRELAYTRKRVDLIGYELGFQDPSYFSRRFRRVTGQSPLDYRQRLNEGRREP